MRESMENCCMAIPSPGPVSIQDRGIISGGDSAPFPTGIFGSIEKTR